ncbi:methionyl-tRNA formyltransferase [Blattabacterium cuenoti]|uniref:methionyl-tRNA formyltransferase n=1 Tax=Blattabacterium cuenoti TaxID=1653831 RepID=UPI00163C4469|nr:methionyl-tRNA formyltransferase [Blattabacterium cuenoti]
MKKFPKIVFIGSSFFSFFSLKELFDQEYNIIGIVTSPDNIKIKGKKKNLSPIKKYAIKNRIPILQPKNLIDSSFFQEIKKWNADIQIVVSFKILPKKIWSYPKMGTFNLHASLLPQYKGAAPINWAIMNGENKTGLTTFFISNQIDSGNILLQKEIQIKKEDTAGDLEKRLKKISGPMIIKTLEGIIQKKIKSIPQNKTKFSLLKNAPKISTKDCKIFWKESSIDDIYNKIRGLSPSPTAWTYLSYNNNKFVRLKIFFVKKLREKHNHPIGLVFLSSQEMKVSVTNGFIFIMEAQIEGRKKMNIKNLINGIKIKENLFVL